MSSFHELLSFIRDEVNSSLKNFSFPDHPKYLYDPIRYMISGKGKRYRPILVHLSGRAFRVDPNILMDISVAVEFMHNFTLAHDDIMDQDDQRHGKETVHKKWDVSSAILAGDGLFTISQLLINNLERYSNKIYYIFNKSALDICEGQALDIQFENDTSVSSEQYIYMIKKKTGALLGACASMPALMAGKKGDTLKKIFKFGENLGCGYQIQDDLLEIYSDPLEMGKSLGSDVVSGKQTLMVILAREKQKNEWEKIINSNTKPSLKILRSFFSKFGIDQKAKYVAESYFNEARQCLREISDSDFSELFKFINLLEKRKY